MTTLNIRVSEKAEAFAALEAAKRGLPNAAAFAAALLEETANKTGTMQPTTAFHDAKTDLDALVQALGVSPIADVAELKADLDEFMTAVRGWRNGVAPDARQ
jgi:hypothetical protein